MPVAVPRTRCRATPDGNDRSAGDVRRPGSASSAAPAGSQPRPDRPQVGKEVLTDRRSQVSGASRSSRARFGADRPLHHFHVTVPPFLDAFVEVDQTLAEFGIL